MLVCRARLDDVPCHHGQPEDPDQPSYEDGTWDGNSIVCDACYVALMPFTRSGAALNSELPEAIEHYRAQRAVLAMAGDPQQLANDAQEIVRTARPGSPMWASAAASMNMALREVAVRQGTPDPQQVAVYREEDEESYPDDDPDEGGDHSASHL